jgi:hypothetical protein
MNLSRHEKEDHRFEDEKSPQFLLLQQLFSKSVIQNISSLSRTNRIKREIYAGVKLLHPYVKISEVILFAVNGQLNQSTRVDLRPSTNTTKLLNEISKYIPINAHTQPREQLLSKNTYNHLLKPGEEVHTAMEIKANDLLAFFSQNYSVRLPQLVDTNTMVTVLGVTNKNQPMALLFLLDGRKNKADDPSWDRVTYLPELQPAFQ